jgi:DNA-binding response OmpR family regulator
MALAPLSLPPELHRGGRRVLFADDDAGMRAIVLLNLQAEGFEVTAVEDGENALLEAERLLPDLIEVLRALKAQPATAVIPVVLLTAKATDADVWEGWKSGADYYMTKPFNPEDLARFAHHALGFGGI